MLQSTGLTPAVANFTDNVASVGSSMYAASQLLKSAVVNTSQLILPSTSASVPNVIRPGKQIWSITKQNTSVENALYHWNKHGKSFPELQNSQQYVEKAWNFFKFPPRNVLSKTRSNGEILIYEQKTNTFGSYTKDGIPKTMYHPTDGIKYWEVQK